RAEETLDRLSRAYGAVGTDVFVITSSIVVTFSFPDGTVITESRRLRRGTDYDFEKLSAFNALSRACAICPLSREELKERIRTIAEKRPSPVKLYVGSALAAGAFCVFFGGSVWDGLLSALFGLLVPGQLRR
ncbi:MAG: threonine/serine exporter family protein, partial [Oscillospiraceae bacterium]|nr:threonine/serine exporter family protein [Oscillospiraceae bacterium]